VTPVRPVGAIGIVVPAHDEQHLLPACLSSLRVAARHPALRAVEVHLVVVLDACSDDSGALAPGAVEVQARNVGVARAAGFDAVLAREAGRAPGELWLATTDADSTVPGDWLAEQLRLAARGAEVVAGTVRVKDWVEQPPAVRHRFERTYGAPGPGHRHVHGANLGMSASAYLDAGGVPPLALAEDQALVDALRLRARRLVSTGRIPVATSGRRESRTVGGFADHLRGLTAG
jgi:glycosyltransferase involved in cell wall biosynthesis